MSWIEVNGASLRYDLSGNGREPLVLIHEVGGCMESWDDVLPAFQRDFRVLRYDQRGSGRSEKVRTVTTELLLADLEAVLAGCALPPPWRSRPGRPSTCVRHGRAPSPGTG